MPARIGRRAFMMSGVAAGIAAAKPLTAEANAEAQKLELSVPLTHSDWMMKENAPAWGPDGVRHMLDQCKACGWMHVYWRVYGGGRATYKSNLMVPGYKLQDADKYLTPIDDAGRAILQRLSPSITPQRAAELLKKLARLDYDEFDSLAAAIEYGHRIGLKIHAWATINEDDHGWGWCSEFAKAHPQYRWVRRDGRPYRSQLSFAFPEVQAYKLALMEELLQYDIDGLFLDWIRTGDVRDDPQTDAGGVADSGYERPNKEAFESKYGRSPDEVPNNDERWVRIRAEPQTIFMRELRQRIGRHSKPVPVAVLVAHPWHYRGLKNAVDGNLRGLLLDVETWAAEGMIDAAIPAGYYREGGSAEKAYQTLKAETHGKVDLWHYAWVPQSPEEFNRDCDLAIRQRANRLLLWEADYIDDRPRAAELKAAMSQRATTG